MRILPALIFLSSTVCARIVHYGTDPVQATGSGESIVVEKSNFGEVSAAMCPRGTYRDTGLRSDDCTECPKGTYGGRSGLTSISQCTKCPAGRYSDKNGRQTIDDCSFCPPGFYGDTPGLTSKTCTGPCPDGKFSEEEGLTDIRQCKACPIGYRGRQCNVSIIPRKGTWTSVTHDKVAVRIH